MPITIDDLISAPLIMEFDLDKRGRYVVYSSNETGIPQLHSLPIKTCGQSKQVTTGEDPVRARAINHGFTMQRLQSWVLLMEDT
ncbi:MAG: hypothetical protein PVF96_07345 [Candidatus Bathyarchaeota archaeon]|jgi:hypothetical protein